MTDIKIFDEEAHWTPMWTEIVKTVKNEIGSDVLLPSDLDEWLARHGAALSFRTYGSIATLHFDNDGEAAIFLLKWS